MSDDQIFICWHGTDEDTAKVILRDGFKPHTHFAAHLEDALCFGGPFIFDVVFKTEPKNWQFVTKEQIPPEAIRSLTQFRTITLSGPCSYTRSEWDESEPRENDGSEGK